MVRKGRSRKCVGTIRMSLLFTAANFLKTHVLARHHQALLSLWHPRAHLESSKSGSALCSLVRIQAPICEVVWAGATHRKQQNESIPGSLAIETRNYCEQCKTASAPIFKECVVFPVHTSLGTWHGLLVLRRWRTCQACTQWYECPMLNKLMRQIAHRRNKSPLRMSTSR